MLIKFPFIKKKKKKKLIKDWENGEPNAGGNSSSTDEDCVATEIKDTAYMHDAPCDHLGIPTIKVVCEMEANKCVPTIPSVNATKENGECKQT